MRKIILALILVLSITTSAMAAEEMNMEELEGLYSTNKNDLQLVSGDSDSATYGTNDYKEGLFDLYQNLIVTHDMPKNLIDNNTQTVYRNQTHNELTFKIELNKSVTFTGFYVFQTSVNIRDTKTVNFYDEENKLLGSVNTDERMGHKYFSYKVRNVKRIEIVTPHGGEVAEYEFFVDPSGLYSSVIDLSQIDVGYETASFKWENPVDTELLSNKIYLNDELVESSNKPITTFTFNDLIPDKEYKITVSIVYKNNIEIYTHLTFRTEKDTTPPSPVKDLKIEQVNNNVKLTYKLPNDDDFSFVKITRDGMLLKTDHKENSYLDTANLSYNKDYIYRIVSYDKAGNESQAAEGRIKLLSNEITNITAKAKYNRVDLSWDLPSAEGFQFVKIYRTNKNEEKPNLFMRVFAKATNEKAIFETNGTHFNDLTVDPDTRYIYRLTAFYETETDGITKEVKTPKISVDGGGTTVDPDGNYLIKWDSPTTGKMKVLIAGVEYKIVPAADKQIVVPKDKMKFDLLGMPDVQLVPIDDDRNEGLPSKPGGSGGNGGNGGGIGDIVGGEDAAEILNPNNLLDAGVKLVGLVGLFLLLGLSFLVVPKLIRTIRLALETRNSTKNDATGRRTNE